MGVSVSPTISYQPAAVAGSNGGPPGPPGGGGPAPPPDLATVLVQLQAVLAQLQPLVDALAGQSSITGGGAPGQVPTPVQAGAAGGCGSSSGAQQVGQTPAQVAPGPATSPGDSPAPGPVPAPAPAPSSPPSPPGQGDEVRQKIVDVANAELAKNVKENGDNRDDAGNIVKYRTAVTGAGEDPNAPEPWCADFVSWVMQQAGVPVGAGGKGEDYVKFLKDWGQKEGRWHDKGSHTPKPGDMIIYDWTQNGTLDHVGIVTAVDGNSITTVAGNEGDAVSQAHRRLGDADIAGFITPG